MHQSSSSIVCLCTAGFMCLVAIGDHDCSDQAVGSGTAAAHLV